MTLPVTRRRAPRPARRVLGGVGAGAMLAMTAPLAPLGASLPDPGTGERTAPLRLAGAASTALPTADALTAGPGPAALADVPDALDIASAARMALAVVPPDPGSAASAALAALDSYRDATAAARSAAAGADGAGGGAGDRADDRSTTGPRPAAPAPSAGLSGELARVVELTNAQRSAAGCGALRVDPRINAAAQGHSEDMARNGYFDHDSRDGRDFADRISEAGYPSPGAENIAMGQPDAESVVQAWMDSPGHRANILNCSLTTIGVGLADGYWTQNFGR
ncbi:CAP domain-containing protein [Pseudonocardia nematodicida]|uniref:CAP domain-containing protein n=1 Tax=Pseudonocardia nematodicida TaxID=1206997 RepID=A0ABV1KLW6_9PSEU